jgi:hypothetical protein
VSILEHGFLFEEFIMSLKKNLRSNQAQIIAEYIVTFVVLTAAIVAIFWCFNPDNLSVKTSFDDAVNSAIRQIGE